MDDFIPLSKVQVTGAEIDEVSGVLHSGWLTTGPRTREFEKQCKKFLGCRQALVVNSGTAALHLAVSALGIGPGDEVITTPLTFAACVNAILYVGATPILADIEADTLNLSPDCVAAQISNRTKAVMVVHYGGAAADLEAFELLAKEKRVALVEDAAHAMGARYRGKRIGADSHAACFSFHPAKNMTTGEGGLLATDDDEIERLARLRSWHGIDKSALNRYEKGGSWYYEVQELGFKYNMTDLQAAIGIHQLERLDAVNCERRQIAAEYDEAFADLEGVRFSPSRADTEDSRHLYWLVLDDERYDRDRFIQALSARGIGTSVHYIPMNLQPYYRRRLGWGPGMCPIAERSFRGLVSIPLFQGMTAVQRRRVMEGVPASLLEAQR